MNEPMSDERLEQIHQRVRDALWGLEVKGDTDWAEIVVRSDVPELLAEVKRLREALTITDEMVERGDELRDSCRDEARRILEAALGGDES